MAISFGGLIFLWNSGTTIGLFICSGILFILLGVQQEFSFFTVESQRIFPVQYLRDKELVILFCQIAAASTNSFIAIYFIPLYFQFVQADAALRTGVRLLPYIIPLVVATMLNGIFMEKLVYYTPWFLAGGILVIVSNVMLFQLSVTTSAGYIYAALVIGGIGTGLFVNASFTVAQWLVHPREIADAVGFITCAQVAGVTISLAIANAVFLNLAQNSISNLLPGVPRSTVQGAISGVNSKFLTTLSPAMSGAVLGVIIDAIKKVFILGIAPGCLAVVLAVFMSREKINLNLHQEEALSDQENLEPKSERL